MKRVSRRRPAGGRAPATARAATIYDVAREAGVSPASVSRVMNGTARVSESVAQRVREAIAKVDFHPYDLAAGRARRTMGIVGLVIPDVTNPFWAEVALGAEEALRPHGYGLMLSNAGDSLEREEDVIALLRRKRADGALVSAMRNASRALHRLRDAGTAVVLLGLGADDGTFDLVTADGGRGIYLTTSHLLDLGHRRIAFVGGPPDQATSVDRRAGYERALAERGISPPPAWIAEGPGWGHQAGGERARELLARRALDGPERVTGIVAANDVLAFGALGALDAAGRRVPDDVSVTGFDDLPLAALCRPPLTTAAQFSRERGRIAAQVLL
ncbi:MAG TPA: LacI family DNA-binding transcriptional regulator, partial [Chloroflexota bacterium]|nr:LacI family DNA-binding transcriptional regulator [Chloroflexota bacterium]